MITQRMLSNGLEVKSEDEYKGYVIYIRTYPKRPVIVKIIKVLDSGKKKILREEHWNFCEIERLKNRMKNYIDNFEHNLLKKLNQ